MPHVTNFSAQEKVAAQENDRNSEVRHYVHSVVALRVF